MDYQTIKTECEQIKKIYGEDVDIEVRDTYYVCSFKSKIGWFEFLISKGKVDEPHGLEFSLWKNDQEKVKTAILALKEEK